MNSREIKFRVWTGKEMVPWDVLWNSEVKLPPDYGEEKFISTLVAALLAKGNNDFTALQFTGLAGKDGVEIYEGDILGDKIPNSNNGEPREKFAVSWIDSRWIAVNKNDENLDASGECDLANYVSIFTEVLGNIFENPDF